MSKDAYHEALSRVLDLTPEEQLQLIGEVISIVRHRVTAVPLHSVMEFEGMGKEIWQGIDVEKYIQEERNSCSGAGTCHELTKEKTHVDSRL